jgi:hypothetical protein
MCEGHRLADLFEGAEILAKLLARFASLSEGLGQSSAANDLHRKERSPVGVAQLIDRHDAGMLQLSADLSLFDEACRRFGSSLYSSCKNLIATSRPSS